MNLSRARPPWSLHKLCVYMYVVCGVSLLIAKLYLLGYFTFVVFFVEFSGNRFAVSQQNRDLLEEARSAKFYRDELDIYKEQVVSCFFQ